jgi:twitching motility protein PilT
MEAVLKLGQLLAYLDRDGISEIVVGTGRPITVKKGGAYQPLLSTPMSTAQIQELVRGSELTALIPEHDTNGAPSAVRVLGKGCRVQIARRGDSLIIKIEAASVAPAGATPAAASRSSSVGSAADEARRPSAAAPRGPETSPPRGTSLSRPAMVPPKPAPAPGALDLDELEELPAPSTITSPLPVVSFSPSSSGRPASAAAFAAPAASDESFDLDFDVPSSEDDEAEAEPSPGTSAPLAARFAAASSPSLPAVTIPQGGEPARARVSAGEPPTMRPAVASGRAVPERFVALVRAARQRGATDLHLSAGQPALIRCTGQLQRLGEAIDAAGVAALIEPWLSASDQAALQQRGYVDLALDIAGSATHLSRVRANVSRQRGGLKGSFRLVWEGVPTLELLGLPRELSRVTSYHQGLVVIAGPSGHGKTTTLAALVDLINSTRPHHILCIEDPVEVVHPRKLAVVSQREVGLHTDSFATALKASLREDPDVIVIGEVRDRETVEIALTAAETGHLVIATMSTPSAAKTIDRVIDMFPPDDQTQVRVSLASALRFIVAQRLLPRRGGEGVVPAVELLTGVLPVAALIRDNKLFQLPNLQQRGRAFGMIRFDDSILELVRGGLIDEAVAVAAAENKREMHATLHPPEPVAAPSSAKPWDDAKQRLGGLFKRDKDKVE